MTKVVISARCQRSLIIANVPTLWSRWNGGIESIRRVFFRSDRQACVDGANQSVDVEFKTRMVSGWIWTPVLRLTALFTNRPPRFLSCYEGLFILVDSMLNQHAVAKSVTKSCVAPIASLNYSAIARFMPRSLNTGFSHQDPGFVDHVLNKKSEIVRVYLPLIAIVCYRWHHCLRRKRRTKTHKDTGTTFL
jgi:hypothetical protein